MIRLALAGVLALVVAACSQAPTPPSGELRIEKAWIRATPPDAPTAAGYLNIVGGKEADRLLSASSPAAQEVVAHLSEMKGGMMTMSHDASGVAIAAGETVVFAPNGRHLMFTGLKTAFIAGDTVPVVLTFEKAGVKTVEIPVLVAPPKD